MLGKENNLIYFNDIFNESELKNNTITHYTSIFTLLRILKNKSFKFNRIDNVNDLDEKERLLINNNYRRVFISCFSAKTTETIPMWKMYTQKDTGVMLQIRFRSDSNAIDLFERSSAMTDTKMSLTMDKHSLDDFFVDLDVIKVKYGNNTVTATTYVPAEKKVYNIPANFGAEKNNPWAYEKEIRYRAIIESSKEIDEMKIADYACLFVKINFDAIEKITIVFNPWMSKEDGIDIIETIRKKEGISTIFKYKNSKLYNNMR